MVILNWFEKIFSDDGNRKKNKIMFAVYIISSAVLHWYLKCKMSPNDTKGREGVCHSSVMRHWKNWIFFFVFRNAFSKEKGYFFGKSKCHVTPKGVRGVVVVGPGGPGGSAPVSLNDTLGKFGKAQKVSRIIWMASQALNELLSCKRKG